MRWKEDETLPKLIEHLREKILQCAKDALLKEGYAALTIRGVAKTCGIAVGTVYNYFPSKDMLAGAVMLEDWMLLLERVRAACARAETVGEALCALHGEVSDFYGTYRAVWAGYSFSGSAKTEYVSRHNLLVSQLVACIRPVLERLSTQSAEDTAVFLVENVLICVGNSQMTFDRFLRIANRLF